jgi:hypothetical protein
MSDGFGSYGFVSWVRRGMGATLTTPDAASLGQPRVALPIQVSVTGAPASTGPVVVNGLFMYGPGEVSGLNASALPRIWPPPGATDVESNYFPIVEIVPADLPWQYTPSAPDATYNRLRPWLCLIVLEDSEFDLPKDKSQSTVTVHADTPLPKLSQAWAWAHVQIAGYKNLAPTNLADLQTVQDQLTNHPENLVARLICPRRLKDSTHYSAFLVPVFARGVQAGLGTPPDDSVDGLAPSWSDQDAPSRSNPLTLPVYYAWSFGTAAFGDFAYLVQQLKKLQTLPASLGTRPMDVSNPGGGLPGAAPGSANILGLEGALKVPGSGTAWSNADRQAWTNAFVALTQASAPVQTAIPLYGRWHAARTALNAGVDLSKPLLWFDDLNTDPRTRVAAGLGTAVVQAEQQQLMASAWKQGAGILEINAQLRHAQLGREVSNRLFTRHLRPLAADVAMLVSAPVHSRIRYKTVDCVTNVTDTRTLSSWLESSLLPRGFLDPQWRRMARSWGGPKATLGWPTHADSKNNLWDRLMNGSFVAVPPPTAPFGIALMSAAGVDATSLVGLLATPPKGPSNGAPANYYPLPNKDAVRPNPPATSDNQGTAWSAFGQAAKDLAAALAVPVRPAVQKCPQVSATLSSVVMKALQPSATMAAAYSGRVQLATTGAWRGLDPLGPVYLAPNFPQPAFEPLRKLSNDWVIPGLDEMPFNSICLLESNDRFIEAYLAGMNFELGRELLWNGIPTDQRGTYFRQFWDHSSALTASGQLPDPQARYDIDVMTHWTQPLGENPNPVGMAAGSLFLLIRGDLLHRYPKAQLYVTKAIIGPDGKHAFPDVDASPPPQEKYPLFSGTLPIDVAFFAFDLPYAEAYGDPNDPTKPGWYFVLQEHAAETRFGFEAAAAANFNKPVADWENVSWGSFAADEATLDKLSYIDLDAALPDTSQAQNPGDPAITGLLWNASKGARACDIAYVTLRDPVRVAIHASALLPPLTGGS